MARPEREVGLPIDAVPAGHVAVRGLRHERTGSVVAARRDNDDALVVLRVLPTVLAADSAFVSRLRRDVARLVDRPHPTVIEAHAFIDSGTGTMVVESEFSDGIRLDELLTAGRLPVEAALAVSLDVLDALAWYHHLGVIHLDVRPGTVVVESRGTARLGDAGIAVPTFRHHVAPGTPAYMAPELWNDAEPSRASDVYAATAVAFELLTGAPPFAASRLQALRAAHMRAPVAMDKVPGFMHALINQGLAKDAADRPRSAAACRDAVRAAAVRALGVGWEARGRSQLATSVLCAAAFLPSARISGMAGDEIPAVVVERQQKRELTLPPWWRRVFAAAVLPTLLLCATAYFWTSGNGSARNSAGVGGAALAAPQHPLATPALATSGPVAAAPDTPPPAPTTTPVPTPHNTPAAHLTFTTPTPKPTPTPVPTPTPPASATPSPSVTPTPAVSPTP